MTMSRYMKLLLICVALGTFVMSFGCGSEFQNSASPSKESMPPLLDDAVGNSYLSSTIEPCVVVAGFDADPCERRFDDWDVIRTPYRSRYVPSLDPPTVESSLSVLFGAPEHVPHLIVRGTVIPGTTRCDEQTGVYLGAFGNDAEVYQGPRDTCFADLRVNEYIVGRGPARITVRLGAHDKVDDFGDKRGDEDYTWLEGIHSVFEGSEWIFGLKVPIDFYFAAWTINYFPWDLQKNPNGGLVVVDWRARQQSELPREDNGFEVTLDEFRTLVKRMHAEHLELHGGRTGEFGGAPFVLTDANVEFLHAHMSHGPVFNVVDATPHVPPPAPGEGDLHTPGQNVVDPSLTSSPEVPGGLEGTATPVSALGDEPTATVTVDATATAEADPIATATVEPTVTPEPAPTPEPEDTPTPEAEVAPTATPEPAPTPEPEPTATETPTPEPEPTATDTPTPEPEPTATDTPEPVIEPTATPEDAVATDTPEPEVPAPEGPGAVGGEGGEGGPDGTGPDG